MPTVDASGWTVAITHPETGRVRQPDVLDTQDAPTFNPGLNAQPRVRIPVRKDDAWLDPVYDDDPEMQVWRDGDPLPIDVLRDVEREPDRITLIGVGGVELEKRVEKYYDIERRHLAAEDLIANDTSYTPDVDEPVAAEFNDTIASLSTQSDFEEAIGTTATDPAKVDGDTITPVQSAFVREATDDFGGGATFVSGDDFVGGDAVNIDGNFQYVQFGFTLEYDIPPGSLSCAIRGRENAGSSSVTFEATVGGKNTFIAVSDTTFQWSQISFDEGLQAGSYTLRFEFFDSSGESNANADVDVIALYDDRFTYTFDNTLSEPGGHLTGPQLYPINTQVETQDFPSQFAVIGGQAQTVVSEGDSARTLQLSNDSGETYLPTDGSESNTNSIDVDFTADGSAIRARVGLERFGSRTGATPTTGYQARALQSLEISADLLRLYLLLDDDRDATIAEILTYLTAETRYLWVYQLNDAGDPIVTFTQPEQRVADEAPEVDEASIEKAGDVFERITVKGSPKQIDRERFTASASSAVSLEESAIIGGSEAVTDPDTGEQFIRGSDYVLNREPGEIELTAGTDMNDGEEYAISYRSEISGTYTSEDAGPNPRELVRQVSGVTTEQQAAQAAFVLVDDLGEPRYAGDIRIPRTVSDFDPSEAIPLEGFGIPDSELPLEVTSDPETTERGLRLRLGTRPTVEEALSTVRSQLDAVSKRT